MNKNQSDPRAAAEAPDKSMDGDVSRAQERPAERAGADRGRFSPLRYELAKIPADNEPTRTGAIALALLHEAQRLSASDIHVEPTNDGYEVRFRVDGALSEMIKLKYQDGLCLVRSFKSQAGLDPGFTLKPLSGRAEIRPTDRPFSIRVSTVPSIQGEKLALRLLPSKFTRMLASQLGFNAEALDELQKSVQDARGMILVSGPTGAGKTTTLYALLHELKSAKRSIVTIEDPVEYILAGVTQIQVSERQGLSFAEGIKGILRLDPDIIMMGEMRDRASAAAAIEAAESGHVFLSTLHARDAAGTLTVLRNFGLTDHEIAATVDLVVAQRLVRRLCSDCRRLEKPTTSEEQLLTSCCQPIPEKVWHAVGCEECGGTGYRGRVGVFESYRLEEEHADAILAHADEHTFRKNLRRTGARSIFEDGMVKATAGLTSLTEIQGLGGLRFFSPRERPEANLNLVSH